MDSFIWEVPQRNGFMGSKGDKRFGGDICDVREPVCCRSDVRDGRGCLYHSGSKFCGGWTELKGVLIESSGGQSNHPTLHLDSRKSSSPICSIPIICSGFAARRSAPGQPIHANTKGGYFLEIVIHSVRVLDELISWPYGDDYYMVIPVWLTLPSSSLRALYVRGL